MIPNNSISQGLTLTVEPETSRTYQLFQDKIQGFVTEAKALKQAIYKILSTPKYEYPIYSFQYGIMYEDLIGKDPTYVKIELKRRICECLMEDERVTNVDSFEFNHSGDEILCTFEVNSIYGNITISKEVNN